MVKKYMTSFPDGITEQEFFEKELGINLNPTLPKNDNFWKDVLYVRGYKKKPNERYSWKGSLDVYFKRPVDDENNIKTVLIYDQAS